MQCSAASKFHGTRGLGLFRRKATPNPRILQILQEEGCGVDCATLTVCCRGSGFSGGEIMFSANMTPFETFPLPTNWRHSESR